jgi:matrixin
MSIRSILSNRLLAGFAFALLASPSFAGIQIRFSYDYDSSGFFSGTNASRRQVLEAAANVFENRIRDSFPAIDPTGIGTLTLSFLDPSTGESVQLQNQKLQEDTVLIYVGARVLDDFTSGRGGRFAWNATGPSSFVNLLRMRNTSTNFDSLGGAISFNTAKDWYFGLENIPAASRQVDFWSVAVHEIGHVLGFSQAVSAFKTNISGNEFIGGTATNLFGGAVPLSDDLSHWKDGTLYNIEPLAMDPSTDNGERKGFTELDFAALKDIGYEIVPPPGRLVVLTLGIAPDALVLEWRNGIGPFQVWQSSDLMAWETFGVIVTNRSVSVPRGGLKSFFRVEDLAP